MRLSQLLATFSFVLLAGCLRPEKPILEACSLDAAFNECICGMTGQGANTKDERKPMAYCDKATAFPPKSWNKYKNYIDELEVYASELERELKAKAK
jgi:hypothetical protein